MTTAEERKARREERLMKEAKRRYIIMSIWTVLKFAGSIAVTGGSCHVAGCGDVG